jgi:diphthamide synthase (EF-2-diphthine--ammonia ligase)
MHGVRQDLLDRQLAALELPATKVRIPSPCPNEVYEARMGAALKELRRAGVQQVVFGDLFLAEIRTYRETQLRPVGMQAVFPLWLRNTTELARQMLRSGLRAVLTCVDPRAIDRAFAGRWYDQNLLDELPGGVDWCGEHGEFHTVVTAGPMLRESISVEVGPVLEREGFVFADVRLVGGAA